MVYQIKKDSPLYCLIQREIQRGLLEPRKTYTPMRILLDQTTDKIIKAINEEVMTETIASETEGRRKALLEKIHPPRGIHIEISDDSPRHHKYLNESINPTP